MTAKQTPGTRLREDYQQQMLAVRNAFASGASGRQTIAARSAVVDALVQGIWAEAVELIPRLGTGIALLALGGYGRRELFPHSDVDLLFLLDGKISEEDVKQPIRRVSQELGDCGIRLSPQTRKRSEAEKFESANVEFALAELDHRLVAGDSSVYERFATLGYPKLLDSDRYDIIAGLVQLTSERHKKYGDTLFHLEPSIKDCPGGLRDVHVCGWLDALLPSTATAGPAELFDREEFQRAVDFLYTVRCFLHFRHERDDNTLNWQAQDDAARAEIGLERQSEAGNGARRADAAYWMRAYFRHARAIDRRLNHSIEAAPAKPRSGPWSVVARSSIFRGRRRTEPSPSGFRLQDNRLLLNEPSEAAGDPAQDPDTVLQLFGEMARTGARLDRTTELRVS